MFDLSGKVALVTGGSMGLGLTFSDTLAEAGADIALTARTEDLLEQNAAGLRERHGRRVSVHPADVTDADAVADVVVSVIAEHGRIDVLVDNAGISDLRGLPSEHSDHVTFRRVIGRAAHRAAGRRVGGPQHARRRHRPRLLHHRDDAPDLRHARHGALDRELYTDATPR
jgi:NAD(P)-dependent dehydrogenase (short-subunit alcohol dehydrogenase family)